MEIVFVLARPAVPENVGAAARALKTMGFGTLRIVASQAHREKGARILAHGAGELLEEAMVGDTLARRWPMSIWSSAPPPRSGTTSAIWCRPRSCPRCCRPKAVRCG
ncbi:MAG: TrmH family RNA methyltransferase, partial [Spongiibacteraceae bacterium]|nr:TrmH family RNA methyltransferase [Spongiibacteraceae bacterium]